MIRTKFETYMGFAAKARKLASGTNTCLVEMNKGNIKLLIIAKDMAEDSSQKLIKEAEKNGVPYRLYGDTEDLSHMTGTYSRSVFGIKDDNFARCILKETDK